MALADRDFRQDQGLVFPLFLAHPADEEIPGPHDGFGIFLHAPVGAQFIAPLAQGVGKEALLVQPVFPGQFQGHFPEQFQSPGHLDGLEHDEGDPGDEILAQQLFGLISVAHDSGFSPIGLQDTAAGDAAAVRCGLGQPRLPGWTGSGPPLSGFPPETASGGIPADRAGSPLPSAGISPCSRFPNTPMK